MVGKEEISCSVSEAVSTLSQQRSPVTNPNVGKLDFTRFLSFLGDPHLHHFVLGWKERRGRGLKLLGLLLPIFSHFAGPWLPALVCAGPGEAGSGDGAPYKPHLSASPGCMGTLLLPHLSSCGRCESDIKLWGSPERARCHWCPPPLVCSPTLGQPPQSHFVSQLSRWGADSMGTAMGTATCQALGGGG